MRFLSIALLAAAGVALTGCNDDDGGPSTPALPPGAYVRYINAVPDTLNTTVRFQNQVEYVPQTFVNVAFRAQGQGNYQFTQAGSQRFKVFTADFVTFSTAGNTVVLVDTTITFEAGKYYTLLHTGYARAGVTPRQRIVVIEDNIPAPTGIAIRTINANPAGAIDVYYAADTTSSLAGVSPSTSALGYLGVSAYANRATGAFATRSVTGGTTTSLGSTIAPAGTAGTTSANPISGSTIAGSALTAVAFPASPTNSAGVRFANPGVVYFLDNRPPSTAP